MKNQDMILIANSTSPRNIGDQAMLEVLLELVRSVHRKAKITIHSMDPHLYKKNTGYGIDHTFYSWSVFSSKRALVRMLRILQLAIHYFGKKYRIDITFPFKGSDKLRTLINDYEKADLIIFAPGGYLRSQKGITQTLNLFMQLIVFKFAKLFDVRKIVAPISFGPFAYKWQEKIAADALQGLDLVAAREEYSYRAMKKNKVGNLILSSDFALLLKKKANIRKKDKRIILGFTIRRWFDEKRQNDFEEDFTEAIRKFSIEQNVTIQPIVQVNAPMYGDFDLEITKKIAGKLKDKGSNVLEVVAPHNLDSAIDKYANIDLLLGMRMHSNILAATQGVPFVGVSYEYKTEGIMKLLGLGEFCTSCEELTVDKLTNLLNNLYKARSAVRKKIYDSIETIRSFEEKKWNYLLKQGGYK